LANPPGWNPKKATVLPSKNIRGKVNLDPVKYQELIHAQGVRVKVYRTTYCPNIKSLDGAEHEIDCPLCHGAQFIDKFPIDTVAFLQSQSQEMQQFSEGLYDGNSLYASFLAGIELQYFTLVELCDFTEIYIQRIKRQNGSVDVLKYKGVRVNLLVDSDGVSYLEGSDFNLDPNGNIRWCSGKGPATNKIYSINYETAVKFRAIKAVHVNRFCNVSTKEGDVQTKLPEQWILQKVYLVDRKDLDGNIINPNQIRDFEGD